MANILKSFVINTKKLTISFREYDTHEVPRTIESDSETYRTRDEFDHAITGWLHDLTLGDIRFAPSANQYKWAYRFNGHFLDSLDDYTKKHPQEIQTDSDGMAFPDKAFEYIADHDSDELQRLLTGIVHGFPEEPKNAHRKQFYTVVKDGQAHTSNPNIVVKHTSSGKTYYGDYQQPGVADLAIHNFYQATYLSSVNTDKYFVVPAKEIESIYN